MRTFQLWVQVAIVVTGLVQVAYNVQTVSRKTVPHMTLVSQLNVLVSLVSVVLALLWGPRKVFIQELVL